MSPPWRCSQWVSKINWFTLQNTPFLHFICISSAGCSVVKLGWIRGIQVLCLLSCFSLVVSILILSFKEIIWFHGLQSPCYLWSHFILDSGFDSSGARKCFVPSPLPPTKKTLPKLKMPLALRWKERGMLKSDWRMSRYTAKFLDITTEFRVKLNVNVDSVCL